MVTDPARRYRTDPGHPEICNVWKLHHFFKPEWVDEEAGRCRAARIGCVEDKEILAESINRALEHFRQRRAELAARLAYVNDVLESGAHRAHAIARETIREVKERMRLLPGAIHD
jgi:tryptophanyl-tRNA synthetase